MADQISKIKILHFNDCYNVESRELEPRAGAARFKTAINSFRDENTIVLFSGDILGPSIMSTITKGLHMAPVLNECNVDCAVLGNHDFDFGIDNLTIFMEKTNFSWLLSNVTDIETNKQLGSGDLYKIILKNGIKFGIIGLVEEEWLATLATISKDDVIFYDFIIEGRKLATILKQNEKVDFVIALTHMRMPNDIKLCENVGEIDLILGGHDHDYEIKEINNKFIIKSGSDFKEFSLIDLSFENKKFKKLDVKKIDVNSKDFIEDEDLKNELNHYVELIKSKMDTILGEFACDLDGRFSRIRTEETNLGNFVADIMLAATHSDCALLNSGTLRSDRLHKKGPFRLKDLFQILPMLDPMIVLNVTGYQIWKALENGVSQYPKFEGRFPQVSGIVFSFNPDLPPGSRVNPDFIKIGDEYLDLKQNYKLVTKSYLHQGKDGYEILKGSKVLISEEECPELTITIQNHFEAINKILTGVSSSHTHHRQSLVCISRRHSLVKSHEGSASFDPNNNLNNNFKDNLKTNNLLPKRIDTSRRSSRRLSINEIELQQCKLEPNIEGRIVKILNSEILNQLEKERINYFENISQIIELPENV